MTVNIGIRVPESSELILTPLPLKKYYHEYECNIRSSLGQISLRHLYKVTIYDLRRDIKKMANQILKEIETEVLPVFDTLASREMILQHRREYPHFDTTNKHLIFLEDAMIYGHSGDMKKAKELFEIYYKEISERAKLPKNSYLKAHLSYLDELAEKLSLR